MGVQLKCATAVRMTNDMTPRPMISTSGPRISAHPHRSHSVAWYAPGEGSGSQVAQVHLSQVANVPAVQGRATAPPSRGHCGSIPQLVTGKVAAMGAGVG